MRKYKYKLLAVIPIILLVIVVSTNVFGVTVESIFDYRNMPGRDNSITSVDNSISKIWGSVVRLLQVAAVAAFVFAGVRYMFTSADQRADIKKSVAYLMLGSVLVFAATTVIGFVVKVFGEITSG